MYAYAGFWHYLELNEPQAQLKRQMTNRVQLLLLLLLYESGRIRESLQKCVVCTHIEPRFMHFYIHCYHPIKYENNFLHRIDGMKCATVLKGIEIVVGRKVHCESQNCKIVRQNSLMTLPSNEIYIFHFDECFL